MLTESGNRFQRASAPWCAMRHHQSVCSWGGLVWCAAGCGVDVGERCMLTAAVVLSADRFCVRFARRPSTKQTTRTCPLTRGAWPQCVFGETLVFWTLSNADPPKCTIHLWHDGPAAERRVFTPVLDPRLAPCVGLPSNFEQMIWPTWPGTAEKLPFWCCPCCSSVAVTPLIGPLQVRLGRV